MYFTDGKRKLKTIETVIKQYPLIIEIRNAISKFNFYLAVSQSCIISISLSHSLSFHLEFIPYKPDYMGRRKKKIRKNAYRKAD